MSLVPQKADLTGTSQINQGTTWYRDFDFGTDMSAYVSGGGVRSQFKTAIGGTLVFSTAASTIVASWVSNAILRLTIPATASTAATQTSGVYDVEFYTGAGVVERPIFGSWSMDAECTTSAT